MKFRDGALGLALLLALTTFFCLAEGFKQELWLYDANDISLHFTSQAADLSDHSAFLAKATRYCTKGVWNVYRTANFQSFKYRVGSIDSSSLDCSSLEAGDGSDFLSVRHWAASDTSVSSISLYEGRNFVKQEILVTSESQTKIPHSVFSITTTGTSDWRLYEGQSLNGKSVCFDGHYGPGDYFNFQGDITKLGLNTIGSVSKGC